MKGSGTFPECSLVLGELREVGGSQSREGVARERTSQDLWL